MSYNPSTGIVQDLGANDGINQYDVQRALGVSSGDWGTLCTHTNIKTLSKYKPIKDTLNGQQATPQKLTDTDYINRNMGFTMDKFPWNNGPDFDEVIKKIVDNTLVWPSFTPSAEGRHIGNSWIYQPIVINTNFSRISDFDNYNSHSADKYTDTTLVVWDDIKMVTSKTRDYVAKFTIEMWPFCPPNFVSLKDYCMGIAIFSPDVRSGTVYFYVSSDIISNSINYSVFDMQMTSAMFKDFLAKIPSTVREATFYAVGFFAPKSMRGLNNITGTDKYNQLNNCIAVPGLGYDTFVWRDPGSGGNTCLLTFDASPTTILQVSGRQFTARINSVTNNYDITTTVILYPTYIYYTYDLVRANGTVDPTYSHTTRARFGQNTGSVDVTNTQIDQGGNVVHKTTDLSSYNIVANIPLDAQAQVASGDRVIVYLWYLTYNSVPGTNEDYVKVSQFTVPVGVLPRD